MEEKYELKTEEHNFTNRNIEILLETKVNQKYMLIMTTVSLLIFDINKDSFIDIIRMNNIFHFDFHSNIENIFFICLDNNVLIYKIDNSKIDKISTIRGHYQDVNYGCFNPFKSNLFLTASNEGFIKIYDITNSSAITLINLKESSMNKINVKWGIKDIGFKNIDNIIYFEYDNFSEENIKKYYSIEISDFYFLNDNDDSLIIIKDDNIEIVKNNKKLCDYSTSVEFSFYFMKDKILIIINSEVIQLLKINDNNQIKQLFYFEQNPKKRLPQPLFINENFLNSNEICKFFFNKLKHDKIVSYIIISNDKIYNKSIKNDSNQFNIQNIKETIIDIPVLLSIKNNTFKSTDPIFFPRKKKYFELDVIKNELKNVSKRSFLERKKLVKKYIEEQNNKIKKIDDDKEVDEKVREQYINLLILLMNDDTNKDLLKEYLNFIRKNELILVELLKDYYEKFNDELNYYYIVFDTKEMSDFSLIKKIQKDEFIEFLQPFTELNKSNESDRIKFLNILKDNDEYCKNICYFNLPIDISNEQLFYYRNINIFKSYLRKVYNTILEEIRKEKQINNEEIIKSELLSEELDIISSNIKLCFNKFQNSKDFKLINELICSLIIIPSKNSFAFRYNYLITNKNKINTNNQNIVENENTFDNNYKKVNIELDLIKEFYKNILPLECFKSLFNTLNGKNSYYPFENREFTEKFVEDNFKILDSPIFEAHGVTDKFSMNSYFIPFMPAITKGQNLHINQDKIMKNGFFIRTGNHEIGHNFTNVKFYNENCKISISSPRKKTVNFVEGGYYVDLALYGKILDQINFSEALYILNEENYKKTYIDFQIGFSNINIDDLKITGVFKKYCEDINDILDKKFKKKSESIFVSFIPSVNQEITINCGIKNDLLFGIGISDEEYEKIIKKYN